jgi:hypothetical protein
MVNCFFILRLFYRNILIFTLRQKREIPLNASFGGYQDIRGYNCSQWVFQRYGAQVTGCVDDWSGGIVSLKFIYPNAFFSYV